MNEDPIFGTDGIRGRWGEFPLTAELLKKLGVVLASFSAQGRILFATDSRQSGPQILEAIWRGIGNEAEIFYAGILPTAAVSCLVEKGGFDFGVMITASHNPYTDNGVKIFNRKGEKLTLRQEKEIETRVCSLDKIGERGLFRAQPYAEKEQYLKFLITIRDDLKEVFSSLVVDCANGATSFLAKEVFAPIGKKTTVLNASPDGQNINLLSGTEHIELLKEYVLKNGIEAGIAFDGDGDRVLFVDSQGNLLQGEVVLLTLARYLQKVETRFNRKVVATVLTNRALEEELTRYEIKLLLSAVGDRNVFQLMKKEKAILGGEPSGHIIQSNLASCGDGMLTALSLIRALKVLEIEFNQLKNTIELNPSRTESFRVVRRKDLKRLKKLQILLKELQALKKAQTVVRYSGTENKIRLYMEDKDKERLVKNFMRLKDVICSELEIDKEK